MPRYVKLGAKMRPRRQRGTVEERGTKRKYWYGHFTEYVINPTTGQEEPRHAGAWLGFKSEMKKWEAEQELERKIVERIGTSSRRPDDKVTLAWFIDNRFLPLRSGAWSDATAKGNKTDIDCYIRKPIGDVELRDVDEVLCQKTVDDLAKKGFSKGVVDRARVMLKSILELAVDLEFLRRNPAKRLRAPECKPTAKPLLEPETLKRLLDAITDPRDHLVMMIGTFCAVRSSELFGLIWDSLVGEHLFIRTTAWEGRLYQKTKTRASRAPVYLPEPIRKEAEQWKKHCPKSDTGLMFPTANGTPLVARNFLRDCVWPIAERLGIKDNITFQILRRSAATRNQKRGTMKDVQALLRHASIEPTAEIYMQPVQESVKQMVEADVKDVLAGRVIHTNSHKFSKRIM